MTVGSYKLVELLVGKPGVLWDRKFHYGTAFSGEDVSATLIRHGFNYTGQKAYLISGLTGIVFEGGGGTDVGGRNAGC